MEGSAETVPRNEMRLVVRTMTRQRVLLLDEEDDEEVDEGGAADEPFPFPVAPLPPEEFFTLSLRSDTTIGPYFS